MSLNTSLYRVLILTTLLLTASLATAAAEQTLDGYVEDIGDGEYAATFGDSPVERVVIPSDSGEPSLSVTVHEEIPDSAESPGDVAFALFDVSADGASGPAEVTFYVDADDLAESGVDPSDVALARWAGDGWTAMETEPVASDMTDEKGRVRLRASAQSLGTFAAIPSGEEDGTKGATGTTIGESDGAQRAPGLAAAPAAAALALVALLVRRRT